MSEFTHSGVFVERAPRLVTPFDRANIDDIMSGAVGTWFTAHLLRLCQKADRENLKRLRLLYPDVVDLYMEWLNG